MTTRVFSFSERRIPKKVLEEAAGIIKDGGLVIFPTETVYGIGASALSAESAGKIYAAKGRPSDNPLIIHIADPKDAEKYAVTSPLYYKLAEAFMPGPLTVIMPKRDIIPSTVTGGLDTVAVRCPSHRVARRLIRLSGVPIAAPSANISGRPSATNAEYARADFDGKVEMILDSGSSEVGLESTIVKLTGPDSIELLRPGAITSDALSCVCGNVAVSDTITRMLGENERPVCPGMKYKHYAPSKPLALIKGSRDERLAFFKRMQETGRAIIICYDEQADELKKDMIIPVGREEDLATQGHMIFAALRQADKLAGDSIYANLPGTDGFGLALYNRLIRAAAHTVIDAGDHENNK